MSTQSLLWSITPPEGKASWLFGTMHIRDERAYQLSKKLYPLILEADVFVGEMDMKTPPALTEQTYYDARKIFSSSAYDKLRHQLLKSFEIDLAHYHHLHPLMIMSVISNSVLESEHHISLDEHLWNYATQNGKPVMGLESFEEQFKLLHSIDPRPLYSQILKISRNPSAMRKNTYRALQLYTEGKIHELYMLSKSSMKDLRKKIIYKRNKKMTEVISHFDPSIQYFITVGAGHLSGQYGILTALKKMHFAVKPVR